MKKFWGVLLVLVSLFFTPPLGERATQWRGGTHSAEAAVTRPVFFAIEPQYQLAKDFHEGLAAVKREDRWGYIDYLGRVAVPIVHRVPEAGDFSEGFAFVGDHYIDTTGTPAFTRIDEDTDDPRQPRAPDVLHDDGGAIDKHYADHHQQQDSEDEHHTPRRAAEIAAHKLGKPRSAMTH